MWLYDNKKIFVKIIKKFTSIYIYVLVCIYAIWQHLYIPVIEQSSRSVGALPEYWLIMPWLCAFGAGILNVMALWNLRRLGSTVTIGETATPRPSNFAVRSGSIGWAYVYNLIYIWCCQNVALLFHKFFLNCKTVYLFFMFFFLCTMLWIYYFYFYLIFNRHLPLFFFFLFQI